MKTTIKGLKTMKKIIVPLTAIALLTTGCEVDKAINDNPNRSEEHTSELQSQ